MNTFKDKFKYSLEATVLKMFNFDDNDEIDHLFCAVSRYTTEQVNETKKRIDEVRRDNTLGESEKEWILDAVGSDIDFYEDIYCLAESLVILALYKKVEINTVHLISVAKVKIKDPYKIDSLKNGLLNAGIDIKILPGFDAVNETRLINNCIKHSGKVSPELAQYPGWVEGQQLSNLKDAYTRLHEDCLKYLKSLRDKLIGLYSCRLGRIKRTPTFF